MGWRELRESTTKPASPIFHTARATRLPEEYKAGLSRLTSTTTAAATTAAATTTTITATAEAAASPTTTTSAATVEAHCK